MAIGISEENKRQKAATKEATKGGPAKSVKSVRDLLGTIRGARRHSH